MIQQTVLETQYELDQKSSGVFAKHLAGTKLVRQSKLVMIGTYDFSVSGGAVGVISLLDCNSRAATLPKGAIITSAYIDVLTAPTSGGSATIAVGTGQAANDLKAALAIASYTGIVAGIPVGSAATAVKLTADGQLQISIATAALTAGKLNVIVEFMVSI